MPVADTAGFLVVYPNGLKDSNNNQYWNVGWSWLPNTNDVGFVATLIDTIYSRYNINRAKVYAAGLSNGGFMSYVLGARLSNKIAAVASVSGGIAPTVFDTLAPARPIPTLEMHGTQDVLVPHNGGNGQFPSVHTDSVFYFWGNNNLCNLVIDTTTLANPNMSDGSSIQLYEFIDESCEFNSRLYRIIGGVHLDWPGPSSGANMDINAGVVIWNFFNQFELNDITAVADPDSIHTPFISVFPQPAVSQVTIS